MEIPTKFTDPEEYTVGHYVFRPKLRQLQSQDYIQKLTPKESELLCLLCQNMNDVLPRETALHRIWQ